MRWQGLSNGPQSPTGKVVMDNRVNAVIRIVDSQRPTTLVNDHDVPRRETEEQSTKLFLDLY